jgi:hypothetical protein
MYYGMSSDSLKKLYVKDSLENKDGSFTFQVKNLIESGSVSGITKLVIDGEEQDLGGVTVTVNDKTRPVTEISWSSSLYLPYGTVLTLSVPGELPAGEHTIQLTASAQELGQVTISITDTIGE